MTIAELTENMDKAGYEFFYEECEAFDRLLKAEVNSLANIQANEKNWNESVRAGINQFSFHFDKEITRRYRDWVISARLCLRQLVLQEEKKCYPESADAFRRCLDQAEEVLLERTQDEAAAAAGLQDVE